MSLKETKITDFIQISLTLSQIETIILHDTSNRDIFSERSATMRARLQHFREAKGFTQETFSVLVGISRSHYAQIETGDKQPSLKVALRIKQTLGYYGDDIFDDVKPGRK